MTMLRAGADVPHAAARLAEGHVVGYPTDTLYALGARIDRRSALDRLFEIKERPQGQPVTVAVASVGHIGLVGQPNPTARRLATLLPGPLTLVIDAREDLDARLQGTDGSVGVRVPNEPTALQLLARTGPLTATSANLHGQAPALDAAQAQRALGDRVDYYLSGVSRPIGTASTIVDCRGPTPTILREGAIGAQQIHDRAAQRGTA